MNTRNTLLAGALLGGLGVALGAFGAHALKPILLENGRFDTYELAVRYQFYHALALLAVGILQQTVTHSFLKTSAFLLLTGTFLFSGSLYALCFTSLKTFAFITPIGGVLMLMGWTFFALGIWKGKLN